MESESKLYVGNLPYDISPEDLSALFAGAGEVTTADIIKERETGRSKGFGFVTMGAPDQAQKAIQMFNGYEFNGRALTVNMSRPREERPGGGGGFRGGGGGGGGYRGGGGGGGGYGGGGGGGGGYRGGGGSGGNSGGGNRRGGGNSSGNRGNSY